MKRTGWQVLRMAALVVSLLSGPAARAQVYVRVEVVPRRVCVGQPVKVILHNTADPGQPIGLPGDSIRWVFGGAASTPRIVTSGTVTEYEVTYVSAGIFSCSLLSKHHSGVTWASVAPIYVEEGPAVRLGPDTTVCGPVAVRLAPRNALPAGSTLSWPDGSTGPSFLATAPGTYWLEVRSPGVLCSSRVPRVIKAGTNCGASSPGGTGSGGAGSNGSVNWPAPGNIPNIITADSDGHNDYFVLDGLVPAEWQVQVFNRWGRLVFEQAAYDNGWGAPGLPAGLYYYLLRHTPSGQRRRGWVEVLK